MLKTINPVMLMSSPRTQLPVVYGNQTGEQTHDSKHCWTNTIAKFKTFENTIRMYTINAYLNYARGMSLTCVTGINNKEKSTLMKGVSLKYIYIRTCE